MKVIGNVSVVDELGRVLIPRQIRQQLGLVEKLPVEFVVGDDGYISVRKAKFECPLCLSHVGKDDLVQYKKGHICSTCSEEISK